MLLIIASVLCGSSAGKVERVETVDVIEINHVVAEGVLVFTQVIYWRWEADNRLHAAAWRRVEAKHRVNRVNGIYTDTWTHEGKLYKVRSRGFRERWSDFDPELLDRKEWPECRRVWFKSRMCN